MGVLEGKVAVISGAGRGLGRSHAQLFARHGARVVICDPGFDRDGKADPTVSDEVVEGIRSLGGAAVASYADVSTVEGARTMVEVAEEAFGGVDVLVNNAGSFHERLIEDLAEEAFEAAWAVHVTGTLAATAAAFASMRGRGGGVVVNTGSSFWAPRSPGFASYSPAKAAIFSFTRQAALEGRVHGIRVNTLIPLAVTGTSIDWLSREGWFDPERQEEWVRMSPVWSSHVALFLASPLSGGLTGRALQVVPELGCREIAVREIERPVDGWSSTLDVLAELRHLALAHAGREP